MNNTDEYRASVLSALGIEDDVNIRYFADFRKALLTKLGMDFTDEDVRNEERFRLKFLEAINAFSGLSVKTVSGTIASFNDAVYDVPLKSLLVNYGYKASGYESVNVTRCGRNLVNPSEIVDGKFMAASGAEVENADRSHSALIRVKPNTSYFMNGYAGNSYFAILALDENKTVISNYYGGASKNDVFVATMPNNARYVYLNFFTTQKSTMAFYEATSNEGYIAYQGNTYPILLGQTVYGGTLDVVSGKCISALASDGTELVHPIEIQLTPTEVKTFNGNNNLWADCGDVIAKYLAK